MPQENIEGTSRFLRSLAIVATMVLVIALLVYAGDAMRLVSFVFLFGLVQLALGIFVGRILRGHSGELSDAELDAALESYARRDDDASA